MGKKRRDNSDSDVTIIFQSLDAALAFSVLAVLP
jgi:hypothetical protein